MPKKKSALGLAALIQVLNASADSLTKTAEYRNIQAKARRVRKVAVDLRQMASTCTGSGLAMEAKQLSTACNMLFADTGKATQIALQLRRMARTCQRSIDRNTE
jgi:hypothetical protein